MSPGGATLGSLRVVAVGCGQPKKSMGWFHLKQMLTDPRVHLEAVVEPWYLGPGKDASGSESFADFCKEVQAVNPDVLFCASPRELPLLRGSGDPPVLAVIAARTCDAPDLFYSVCERGVSHVYLEKPGADCALELEAVHTFARDRGVEAVVGYNKNVSDYVRGALAELERLAKEGEPAAVTLEHNNAFHDGEELVNFVEGPGAEGMVHNMCCHELALAATLFGVSCERVRAVVLEPENSALVQAAKNGDWKRVSFRLLLDGAEGPSAPLVRRLTELRFSADRCGGNFSQVHVAGNGGTCSFRLPSKEQEAKIQEAMAKDPEVRPYFLQQAADYERLRGGFVQHILEGLEGTPAGVVDLAAAVETLRLADMLAPALRENYKLGQPWTQHPQTILEAN